MFRHPKFRKGDKLRAIDARAGLAFGIAPGDIFTAAGDSYTYGSYEMVEILKGTSCLGSFFASRFEPYEPEIRVETTTTTPVPVTQRVVADDGVLVESEPPKRRLVVGTISTDQAMINFFLSLDKNTVSDTLDAFAVGERVAQFSLDGAGPVSQGERFVDAD